MGHRVYLLSCTAAGTHELFEANNLLPFFWLTLLDQSALAHAVPAWDYADRLWMLDPLDQASYADTWPAPTNLVVAKPALIENMAKAQRLLQASYPELLAAYQEFARYLLAHLPGADDQLHLDVFALSDFSSSAELLQILREQLAAIEQQRPAKLGQLPPTLEQLAGFPSGAHPPGPAYPRLAGLGAVPRPVAQPAAPLEEVVRRRLWLPVAGVLLLYASYLGYRQAGLTGVVVGVALAGVAVTGWGAVWLTKLLRRPRAM